MSGNECRLCPRECGIDRNVSAGYCQAPASLRLARAALHMWEEPVISGTRGSGTIFFSGCNLRCCFCQNHKISAECFGSEVNDERLAEIMLELENQGAHNINLVTPTHYADRLARILSKVKPKLKIPVVYNSSGYEKVSTLDMLDGLVDIYMPDLKYFSPDLSKRYSYAEDYFEKASEAIKCMYSQVGAYRLGDDKTMTKGLLIRHMLLPSAYKDSLAVLDWIGENFERDKILVSIMAQYTPMHKSAEFGEINRRITSFEYKKVTDRAAELGLDGFVQKRDASGKGFVPSFELEGL